MTSFVEEATLGLNDQATSKIRSINRELNKLMQTGRKLGGIEIKLSGADRAVRQVRSLASEITKIPTRRTARIDVSGTEMAERKVRSLAAEITKLSGKAVGVGVNRTGSGVPAGTGRGFGGGFSTADRARFQAESGLIRGTAQGARDLDIADSRLAAQGFDGPGEKALVQDVIKSLSREFQEFSLGKISSFVSEVRGVARDDTGALLPLSREILELAKLQVQFGEDKNVALDSAAKFAKAGEQSGKFTNQDGDIDLGKITNFADIIKKAQIELGVEIDANLIRTLTKSLRTSKFSLDDRGLLTAILLAEEAGSTAGVGINQLIKQLSGERIAKKQRSFAAEIGLLELEEVQTGTEGGLPVIEFLPVGTKDEELLRENPVAWVKKYLIPVMREQGFDPSNPTQVPQFSGKITSDRTATESLSSFILRASEIEKSVDRALSRDVSDERLGGIADDSLLLAGARAGSQIESVLGAVIKSLESVLIPALNATAEVSSRVASGLAKMDSPIAAILATLGVGGAAVAVGKGVKKLLPGSALLKSSANLDTAAAALLKAAREMGGGDGGGKKGKKGLGAAAAAAAKRIPIVGGVVAALQPTEAGAANAPAEMRQAIEKEQQAQASLPRKIADAIKEFGPKAMTTEFPEIRRDLNDTIDRVLTAQESGGEVSEAKVLADFDAIMARERELVREREKALMGGAPMQGETSAKEAGEALLDVAGEAGERMAESFRNRVEQERVHPRALAMQRRANRQSNVGSQGGLR